MWMDRDCVSMSSPVSQMDPSIHRHFPRKYMDPVVHGSCGASLVDESDKTGVYVWRVQLVKYDGKSN